MVIELREQFKTRLGAQAVPQQLFILENYMKFISSKICAKLYLRLFNQTISDPTEYHEQEIRDKLHHLIWVENYAPYELKKTYNIDYYHLYQLEIPTRSLSDALKNYARKQGTLITDEKEIFYSKCLFEFSLDEMRKISGFELIEKHGMFHPVKNPNGVVRDHLLSRAEAWSKGYNPEHIRHPANCQFLTNIQNIKKSSSSDITYDELLARIQAWDANNITPVVATRRKIPKSPEHIQKIRESIIKWHQNKLTKSRNVGRPETFSKKHDWDQINRFIAEGLSMKDIGIKLNISRYDLHKARYKGLISI